MYELLADKMRCGGCAGRVTRAVQTVDDKAVVNVDLRNGTVLVESDADMGAVAAAIAQAGYPVQTSAVRR